MVTLGLYPGLSFSLNKYKIMEEHRKKGASRRSNDRRGEHRRKGHRRQDNSVSATEKREKVDQRQGYQRKANRRTGRDRRDRE